MKIKHKRKPVKISTLKRKAWDIYSIYRRREDLMERRFRDKGPLADQITCCTCGKAGRIEDMHAGHFIARKHTALMFVKENVHCQCTTCNTFLHGNLVNYTMFMIDTYGIEFIRDLISKRTVSSQLTLKRKDYLRIIEQYKI